MMDGANRKTMQSTNAQFENLTPDRVLDAVEQSLGVRLTGLLAPLPSYINRVYELETAAGERLIAKFYRPGRWSRNALVDEHHFVLDCYEADIPVIPPLELRGGDTLGEAQAVFFAVFEKRSGRELNLGPEASWTRLGALLGRIHLAGSAAEAADRLRLHPLHSLRRDLDDLEPVMPRRAAQALERIGQEITACCLEDFDRATAIRIHGDCHRGNILERPGEGLMVIDFDDMMTGPPVQDLWLLLPGHAQECRRELDALLRGYEMFFEFDDATLRLIEPLRAMRLIYFLAWCARQLRDPRFQHQFPEWGSEAFWTQELHDLEHQLGKIQS
jgi:Ser/Thr protein kinase RdoA (MazF antagonist)